MFNVWMQLPAFVGNRRPWSLVAQGITEEQADTLRATLLFPLHVERVEESS